jgi:hypothetical protein
MFLFSQKRQLIAVLLIIITVFLFPFNKKEVHAQWAVADLPLTTYLTGVFSGATPSVFNGMVPTEDTNPFSAKSLGKLAIKRILRELTKQIVTWIENGFENPDGTRSPAFMTNTEEFLANTADLTIGDFLMNDPALSFLCDPFKLQVKLALGLQYRPFKETIECSLKGALANTEIAMNNFMNGDFIGGGGWDSWLQITTVPQNNQMGAMILAQTELDARIEGAKGSAGAELDWGGGFMSWKKCTTDVDRNGQLVSSTNSYSLPTNRDLGISGTGSVDANGNITESVSKYCEIQTPGSVIASKIKWVDTSTLRELEIADDINAIVNALANELLEGGMKSLTGNGLLGDQKQDYSQDYKEYMDYLDNLRAAQAQSAGNNSILNSTNYSTGNNTYNRIAANNFNSQAIIDRNTALSNIESQINIEDSFKNAQLNILNLLNTTINIMASSTCDSTFTQNTINQISGEYLGEKDLLWNIKDINSVIKITDSNLTTLKNVKTSILNSSVDSLVTRMTDRLSNVDTWHSTESINNISLGGTGFTSIIEWIQNTVTNNGVCLGDTSALGQWGIQ